MTQPAATTNAFIPYGAYWSSPFCRWQGALSGIHAFDLAAAAAKAAISRRGLDLSLAETGVLGTTVPQKGCFYGMPWLAGTIGAPWIAGPTIAQACATGARVLATATQDVRDGAKAVLTVTTDRISNGPQLHYPDPHGPGGSGAQENWVLDNFARDPWAGVAMVETAENVARKFSISTGEQHDLVLRRYEQYADALSDDRAFHRRFMDLPFQVSAKRSAISVPGDEGVQTTSAEKLARLRPVIEGGTVTHAGQTHPADGTAGMIVANRGVAREMSANPSIEVEVLAFGQAREEKAMMPAAPIPAARQALARANLDIAGIDAIKTHNPFIVNDIAFARAFGIDAARRMNNFGCSLVFGHPQGPTGTRLIIELIEELALRGGGFGLFAGCAAGDTAMACVVRVGDAT